MKYYVTADLHLGHGKIIQYSNRPFKTSNEMNVRLVTNWNSRVKSEDIVFILGDFCFKSGLNCEKADFWIKQLVGNKIFIRGNHDNNNSLKTIIDCIHVTFANKRINMCHKPEHSNPDFEINLVGHVHNKWKIRTFEEHYNIIEKLCNEAIKSDRKDWEDFLVRNKDKRNSQSVLLNIGVDVQRFMPITLDEAIGQIIRFKKEK